MDVRDYEYIVAIAEQGSITCAAAQLFITQPALTRFLKHTEASLGLKLFTRNGNQFLLTEAGRRYVETGGAIIQLDRQLTHELTMQKTRIRLGSPSYTDPSKATWAEILLNFAGNFSQISSTSSIPMPGRSGMMI